MKIRFSRVIALNALFLIAAIFIYQFFPRDPKNSSAAASPIFTNTYKLNPAFLGPVAPSTSGEPFEKRSGKKERRTVQEALEAAGIDFSAPGASAVYGGGGEGIAIIVRNTEKPKSHDSSGIPVIIRAPRRYLT